MTSPPPGAWYNLSIVAGNGTIAHPVPGSATASPANQTDVAVDTAGNVYAAVTGDGGVSTIDGTYIVKITPAGALSIIAGNGSNGTPVPGPATSSPLSVSGLAVDSAGNIYAANGLAQILKITPDGTLSVIAGEPGTGWPTGPLVPGPATSSPLAPWHVAVDGDGNVYASNRWISGPNAADQHLQIVKVATDGTLSIVAGTGWYGTPAPGLAISSALGGDGTSLAIDTLGNLYLGALWEDPVNDIPHRYFHGEILKITPTGTMSVVAGNANPLTGGTSTGPATQAPVSPADIAVDSWGDIYYSNYAQVMKILPTGYESPIAGNMYSVGPPVPGYALTSPLEAECGLAVGPNGDVLVGVGAGDQTSPSNPRWIVRLTPKALRAFAIAKAATVTGTTRVGYRLYAHTAGLIPGPTAIRYQWLRNGRLIWGGTGTSYLLRSWDRLQYISVRITYARLTYRTLTQVVHAPRRIS